MAGPQLNPINAQGLGVFNIDAVTITRNAGGPNPAVTTIWTGTADFQEGTGDTHYDPSGAVESIDAVLKIDQNAAPVLPSVLVGDIVEGPDGRTFSVVAVAQMTFIYPYLELQLKRGPQRYEQR